MIDLKALTIGTPLVDSISGKTAAIVTDRSDEHIEFYFTHYKKRLAIGGKISQGVYTQIFLDRYKIGKECYGFDELKQLPREYLDYKKDFLGVFV